jgi:hypothetical protein
LKRFDELFNMADGQGKNYANLDYNLRVALFQGLDKEAHKQFQMGRASKETIEKAQSIYDSWFNETHPTVEDQWNKKMDGQARDRVLNLERQLRTAKKQLEHWNTVFQNDGHVPYGERERLRKEIQGLERDLQVNQTM